MCPAIAIVEYWDECDKEMKTEVALIYAKNFEDAAGRLEGYYGKDMESVTIRLYEEGSLLRIDTQYLHLVEEKM